VSVHNCARAVFQKERQLIRATIKDTNKPEHAEFVFRVEAFDPFIRGCDIDGVEGILNNLDQGHVLRVQSKVIVGTENAVCVPLNRPTAS